MKQLGAVLKGGNTVVSTLGTIITAHELWAGHRSGWWDVALVVFLLGLALSALGWWIGPIPGLTRRRRAAEPDVISFRRLHVEDGRGVNPPLMWPLKLRVVLHNDTGSPVEVAGADWLTGLTGAHPHVAPGDGINYQMQLESIPGGAYRDEWEAESRRLHVPPDATFRFWIGVSSAYTPDELRHMHDARQLGTLVLPVTAGGVAREVRLAL